MRYLLFSLLFILVVGCASDYNYLQNTSSNSLCADKIKPVNLTTGWYTTAVDVTGHHISGLLLIKNMSDSSIRVVFTNEAGVTFFDFDFLADGNFKVHSIVDQMDKKLVIQTLRKDFELILGLPFRKEEIQSWTGNEQLFFGVKQKKETAYFITSKDCASLRSIELGSKRKRKVSVQVIGSYPSPEGFEITHHLFDMKLKLTHLPKE
ncbi:MAG: hypothetical protein ABI663_04290 [Chryseolinea sp.]